MILLDALQDAVTTAQKQFERGQDYRLSMVQVLTGPPRSGKTVQAAAYATALYGAGLIAQDAIDIVCCANFTTPDDLRRIITSAKDKVLAIDEFEKMPRDKEMGDMLAAAAASGACALVLTGQPGGMAELQQYHPGLYGVLPQPIALDTVYPRDPQAGQQLQEAREADKRQAAQNRAAIIERHRLSRVWQEMTSVDVSLKTAVKPVKTVRFTPKVPS